MLVVLVVVLAATAAGAAGEVLRHEGSRLAVNVDKGDGSYQVSALSVCLCVCVSLSVCISGCV